MLHLTYAVGDVHGCYDLVRRCLDAIARHARSRPHTIVFLGDYIDRGPDAKRTLDVLIAYRSSALIVCLMGNHEQMLLDCVDTRSPQRWPQWLHLGGINTLLSFGIEDTRVQALEQIPKAYLDWMRNRPRMAEDAHRIYVHAGIAPERELIDQDDTDLLWIRGPFVRARAEAFVERRHVVHGHTPVWEGKPEAAIPELLVHRTNLDTGAYATGVLTVGVFDSDRWGGVVDLLSIV